MDSESKERDSPPTASPPSSPSSPYLAKIYRLGENDKEWQDCGVVRVRCSFVESLNEMAIVLVTEEEPKSVVLETPVSKCEFRRDVSTIISWADTLEQFHPAGLLGGENVLTPTDDSVHEVALSFETNEGCSKIWEGICTVQGKISSDYRIDMRSDEEGANGSFETSMFSHHNDEHGHGIAASTHLPPLSRENLPDIIRCLRGVGPLFRTRLAAELASERSKDSKITLIGVLDLFDEVDKSTDNPTKRKEDLGLLFELVRFIALLDDQKIFEMMLADDCFERVAGCLENDPSMRFQPDHRKFLRDDAKFNQVVPITSDKVQSMITQRFRLGFLRDVLLPRVLDESSFKRLNAMDIRLGSDIAQSLHQDALFVSRLFEVLSQPTSEHRTKSVAFLAELLGLSQKMQVQARNAFYRTFTEGDRLLKICEGILGDKQSTARERLDIGEIILLTLKHDTSIVRNRIIEFENEVDTITSAASPHTRINGLTSSSSPRSNDDKVPHTPHTIQGASSPKGTSTKLTQLKPELAHPPRSLMGLLVDCIVQDEDAGIQAQACQLLEILLDPESIVPNHREDDPFIEIFYSRYFEQLIAAFDMLTPEARSSFIDQETPVCAAHLICGLLSFCVQTHGYVVREVLAREIVVQKVLGLLECREKHLILDAIRFVRTCIGMKEKFYNDYFMQHNLFAPVVKAFVKNGPRNNLINSTVIDLLEFIRSENIVSLVEHIVTNFADDLRSIGDYVNTFAELEKLHGSNQNGGIVKSPSTQSLHSSSSNSDFKKSNSGGGILGHSGRLHRVTASARGNIFGESRPFRDDDDEALFDDDAIIHSGSNGTSSPPIDSNSPSKRARLDQQHHHSRAVIVGGMGDDLAKDFDSSN
jgi:protein phosphatase-4 regulatory subunit 3